MAEYAIAKPADWPASVAVGDTVRVGDPATVCAVTEVPADEWTVTGHRIETGGLTVPADKVLDIAGGTLELSGSLVVYGGLKSSTGTGAILFHVPDDRLFTGNTVPGPDPAMPDFHPDDIGLWAMPGSSVTLRGVPVLPWGEAEPVATEGTDLGYGCVGLPAIGNGAFVLDRDPAGWIAGDTLLLTGLDGRHETATLTGIDGRAVTFAGSFAADAIRNGTALVRPKVANLTRRLVIASADVTEAEPWHRAHAAFMGGHSGELHSHLHVDHVEVRDMGPRGKLGRYPLHVHHGHATHGDGFAGCSIWQTVTDPGSRFVTLHAAEGFAVRDCVGYRSKGHGFFLEDGTEQGNTISGNLSVAVDGPEELAVADALSVHGGPTANPSSAATTHFWMRAGNVVEGNVAVGGTAPVGHFVNSRVEFTATGQRRLVRNAETVHMARPSAHGIDNGAANGAGLWWAVNNVVVESPVCTYCRVAGTWEAAPIVINGYAYRVVGADLIGPAFLLNGVAGQTYASQMYLSRQIGTTVVGGVLAGEVGVHAHYVSGFLLSGTRLNVGSVLEPTYWESSAHLSGCDVTADRLFAGPYSPRGQPFQVCTVESSTGTLPAGKDRLTGADVPARGVNGVYRSKADPEAAAWAVEPDGARRQ